MTLHEWHVHDGYCPAISWTRAWCGKPAGHDGRHGSPRVPYPDRLVGPTNPDWADWDE